MELWSAEQAMPGLMVCIFSFYATDPSVIRLLFVRANQKTLTLTTFGAILSSSHSVNQKYFLRKSCSLQFSWKLSRMKGCVESPWSQGLFFFSLLVCKHHHSEILVLLARLLDVTALTFTFQGWRSFTWINILRATFVYLSGLRFSKVVFHDICQKTLKSSTYQKPTYWQDQVSTLQMTGWTSFFVSCIIDVQ